MGNKLTRIILVVLAAIGLLAVFALIGMGAMMFWMMST